MAYQWQKSTEQSEKFHLPIDADAVLDNRRDGGNCPNRSNGQRKDVVISDGCVIRDQRCTFVHWWIFFKSVFFYIHLQTSVQETIRKGDVDSPFAFHVLHNLKYGMCRLFLAGGGDFTTTFPPVRINCQDRRRDDRFFATKFPHKGTNTLSLLDSNHL